MLKGLIPGDNIVYRVPGLADYTPFIGPYCAAARRGGEADLLPLRQARPARARPTAGAEVCRLDPAAGFEAFITGVHKTIERTGRGGYYVFDCLTDLAADWYSDPMLGNFFMLTCPYLYDVEAIAIFAVLRNRHSSQATEPIAETAQIVLDVYHHKDRLYLHPLKVQQRYSPTMYMLHARNGDDFVPVIAERRDHGDPLLGPLAPHRSGGLRAGAVGADVPRGPGRLEPVAPRPGATRPGSPSCATAWCG